MRTSLDAIRRHYREGEPLAMITAYDYTSARLVDRAGLPLVLVGDSLGMVMQGRDSTLAVTIDDMVYHTRLVTKGAQDAFVVADLPFLTYTTQQDALRNAGRLLAEGGAQSVKLEGGRAQAATVRRLVDAGIPVMGHLGFTPQSVNQIGMKVQGRGEDAALDLLADARALADAGAWGIVLELVPAELATLVTEAVDVPTIGIGAGAGCDGQVQVWHDLLGLYEDFVPRHARRYRTLADEVAGALTEYRDDVRERSFPTAAHTSTMDAATLDAVRARLDD